VPWLKKAGIQNLRVHDLRRTLASWQATTGVSLPIIVKSLGHTSVEATAVYAQVDDSAVWESVENANDELFSAGKVSMKRLLEAPLEAKAGQQ
jgi:integrase